MTIPASAIVNVTPSVLSAGGANLAMNGVILTQSTRVPVGTVSSFPSAAAVGTYFGLSSQEFTAAQVYFGSYVGAVLQPASILFAQYNTAPVAAYLRGGANTLTLAQVQAIKNVVVTGSIGGVVTASIGATFTATGAGTNLTTSSVTGLISIGDLLSGTGVPAGTYIVSQTSGAAGGAGVYVTNNVTTSSAATVTCASYVLNVTGITSGTLQATDVISGTGVTANTAVTAQLTGTAGLAGTYRINTQQGYVASTTVTSLSTVLNVTVAGATNLVPQLILTGTSVSANTRITSQLAGTTGGVGTYLLSVASTTISESITGAYDFSVTVNGSVASSASISLASATSFITAANLIGTAIGQTVTFDSTAGAFVVTSATTGAASTIGFGSGAIATYLNMTSALGAITSQGANGVASPSAFMTTLTSITQNWATFSLLWDPDNGSGNANKMAFANWTALQNNRYGFVCWDTDVNPTNLNPATLSMGALLAASNSSGTILMYEPTVPVTPNWYSSFNTAAAVQGWAASLNFNQPNGRQDLAFTAFSGITPTVTTPTVATNLQANGYNYYGSYATASQSFTFVYPGSISGTFKWADSFINQIWMNQGFQSDELSLLLSVGSIPYNPTGYATIEAACVPRIQTMIAFGGIRQGITLSAAQISAVNGASGKNIASILSSRGWYFMVTPASPSVRSARTSPAITFYYTDGQDVQQINLASIELQ